MKKIPGLKRVGGLGVYSLIGLAASAAKLLPPEHAIVAGLILEFVARVTEHLAGHELRDVIEGFETGGNHDIEFALAVAYRRALAHLRRTSASQFLSADFTRWFDAWESMLAAVNSPETAARVFRDDDPLDPTESVEGDLWPEIRVVLLRWADGVEWPADLEACLSKQLPQLIQESLSHVLREHKHQRGWIGWQQRYAEETLSEVKATRAEVQALRKPIEEQKQLLQQWNGALNHKARVPSAQDLTDYFDKLWKATAHIEITNLRTSDGSANTFNIDELYTPLTTVLARPEQRGKKSLEPESAVREVPLQEALKEQRVVLVGDPGAGKTTFLRRIVFEACHVLLGKTAERRVERLLAGDPPPFPILIRANVLAEHLASCGPKAAPLADKHSAEWLIDFLGASYPDLGPEYFRSELRKGALLLIDSLDEVPSEQERARLAEILKNFARDSAYRATRIVASSRPGSFGGVTRIGGFERVDIAPLGRQARKVFAKKWGQAVHRQDAASAKELTEKLLGEIQAKREIRRMAENPVMLTALACLHFTRAKLPEQRSELYHSVLEWLAKQRAGKTGRDHNRLLALLRALAYEMHAGQPDKRTAMERGDAVDLLAPEFQEHRKESDQRDAAGRFLDEEEINSGIIVNDGPRVRFWHATFQEALAAQELAGESAKRQEQLFDQGKWHQGQWRETVELLAGELAKGGNKHTNELLGKILDDAPKQKNGHILCAGLMSEVLRDLAAWDYTLPEKLDKKYQATLKEALAVFDVNRVREFTFEQRLAAAEAVGQAGDSRIKDEGVWVPVTARPKTLAPYSIGKYPVTVAEYMRFIDAGGYEEEEVWKAGGFGEVSEPGGWERQIDHPNWPVTGVNWYEASAYCAWKSAQTKRRIRLPSEAEWVAAALWGRKEAEYPWKKSGKDDEPGEYKANYWHDEPSSPKSPTPVGLYPEGATPDGVDDLAGNVWEWMASWYTENQSRAVRGSGWDNGPDYLRVSDRDRSRSEDRLGDLGFRCVREEK